MPSINAKVTVGRKNHRIGEHFTHANQTSISQAGWDISVFSHQIKDWIAVVGKAE
jgi:hypothetical protein